MEEEGKKGRGAGAIEGKEGDSSFTSKLPKVSLRDRQGSVNKGRKKLSREPRLRKNTEIDAIREEDTPGSSRKKRSVR